MHWYLLAVLFLPLFPFSILFTWLYSRSPNLPLRLLLMFAWPLIGWLFLQQAPDNLPPWLYYWAILTALLYAFRSLVLRDLAQWLAFMAVSLLSISWLIFLFSTPLATGLSVILLLLPLVFLIVLHQFISESYGGAYAGKVDGLIINTPRLAGLMVFVILALMAMPVSPGFFVLLELLTLSILPYPVIALGLLLLWMLWSWSGMRLLQGFLTGVERERPPPDLQTKIFWPIVLFLLIYLSAGLIVAGVFL